MKRMEEADKKRKRRKCRRWSKIERLDDREERGMSLSGAKIETRERGKEKGKRIKGREEVESIQQAMDEVEMEGSKEK